MLLSLLQMACDSTPWNDPYGEKIDPLNSLYRVFNIRPKHLDPALSYEESEALILAQIYEAPLHYHYLKRPYALEPSLLISLPKVFYYDAEGRLLSNDAKTSLIASSVYQLELKKNIRYQPHPAFSPSLNQHFNKHDFRKLIDFPAVASRELKAADMVYAIKRLANPNLNSPFYSLMSRYILGLQELHDVWAKEEINLQKLVDYNLAGAKVIDDYRYQITLKGKYRQFEYWLAMTTFSPIPWEADLFYNDEDLRQHNITLDWYPIGTGPYMLMENNPERRMTLVKNPNYREVYYPNEGSEGDSGSGLLTLAGSRLPMIEKIIFVLEKEYIPTWKKFLQGYYDLASIGSEMFNQAVLPTRLGPLLTDALKEKGIRLQTSYTSSFYCWSFNMLDETVGGQSPRARKLRQAIAIAFNGEEFLELFFNNRGKIAHTILPPDIFGFLPSSMNASTYYKGKDGLVRYPLDKAKQLLKEAGYDQGIDPKTARPLILYWDTVRSSNPDQNSEEAWLIKQFKKLGIQLKIRGTDVNRYQDKIKQGQAQMFMAGWKADYPDPENFLFLFLSHESKVKTGGENFSNYESPTYDALFEEMRSMPDTEARLNIINKMNKILQDEVVLVGAFHPASYALYHEWLSPIKTGGVIHDTMQYLKVDGSLRLQKRQAWNHPLLWPLGALVGLLAFGMGILRYSYQKKMSRR